MANATLHLSKVLFFLPPKGAVTESQTHTLPLRPDFGTRQKMPLRATPTADLGLEGS